MHINIEIKARCSNQAKIREILKSQGADSKGTDHQIDTYFSTKRGRLKLREGKIENCLVYYERTNQAGPKQSDVALFKTEPNSALKEMLQKSNGVLVVVDKKREIYFIDNVKFHLDNVEGLGEFVEIEAIGSHEDLTRDDLLRQCQEYLKLFGIQEEDLISQSYSDLILAVQPA
ncbi:class IV adenylate cyclase [Candidatus Berkelbacteria bacterium]|nr:class IV adenylate cyclase [Candidatus Berkelbacteria bacterium]